MATKKQLTNRFQSDIDMCNNQIINYSSEYWGDKTEHDHLPDEAHGDVVFEGKHIYLLREYRITLSDGTTYIYQAGSECICHKDPTTGKFYWQKQLSSAISEDLSGAIKQLWKEKSGVIHVYATKAEMEGHKLDAWEMDLAIVDKDESQRTFDWEPAPRTLYIADGDGGEKTTVCKNWRLVCRIADNDRFRLVDEAKETGGKACFAPFHMEPDFSDPEGITVTVDKVRLNNNGPGRVDSIDIPVPKAYVRDDNPLTGTSTAGLYTKALAAEKVDRECTIAEGKSVISNLPSDKGACMVFENKNGIKSGVSVDINAKHRAQIYAANQATGIGTRIDINESGAYYLGPMDGTRDPRDSDEIATLGDIKTIASKCWGTKNTYAELASITGMDVADYVYVLHDEDQLAKRSGETIAPSTRYYFGEDRVWHYACDIGNTSIRMLPNAPDGGPMRLTYFTKVEPVADKVTVTAQTISLDNKAEKKDYPLEIKSATETLAGVMAADDKKQIRLNKEGLAQEILDRKKAVSDEETRAKAAEADLEKRKTDRICVLPNGKSTISNLVGDEGACLVYNGNDGRKSGIAVNEGDLAAQIYSFSPDGSKYTKINVKSDKIYYTKNKDTGSETEDDEISVKGDVSNLKYVESITSGGDSDGNKWIDIKSHTGKGLYTEIKDFGKDFLKIPGTVPGNPGEVLRLPYFFEQRPESDKITVTAHTIELNNKIKVDKTYDMVVKTATQSLAGLMSADDKTKLDGCGVIDDKTEALDNVWSSQKTMNTIKEYASQFAGSYKTHTDMVIATTRPDGTKIDPNDYAVVLDDDPVHIKECWRYKCVDATKLGTEAAWSAEYKVLNVPFTAEQWTTINSGIWDSSVTGAVSTGGTDVNTAFVKQLGNEAGSGQPYHFPYYYDIKPTASGIKIIMDTITLDNKKTTTKYPFTVPAMDGTNAGLYTKSIDDTLVKKNVLDGTANSVFDNSVGQGGCIMQSRLNDADKTIVSFNTNSHGGPTGILAQIYAKNTTGTDAGKGVRLNIYKDWMYLGYGLSTPKDEDHKVAVKGDIKAQIAPQTATITTGGWSSAATGDLFVKNVDITGIKSTDYPIVGTAFDADTASGIEAQQEAAAHIVKAVAYDGGIAFYADETPAVNVPIIVRSM